jgi:uncharacterized protein with HEPN domain
MGLEAKRHLWDIGRARERILQFTAGRSFGDYTRDAMLRSAVERQFEIIGEALNRSAAKPRRSRTVSPTHRVSLPSGTG